MKKHSGKGWLIAGVCTFAATTGLAIAANFQPVRDKATDIWNGIHPNSSEVVDSSSEEVPADSSASV